MHAETIKLAVGSLILAGMATVVAPPIGIVYAISAAAGLWAAWQSSKG